MRTFRTVVGNLRQPCHLVFRVGLLLLCLYGLPSTVQANTLYVQPTGLDINTGLNWQQAKRTVKATLSAAQAGDQIWIGAGVYTENIILKSGVALYGGFSGVETALAQRNWSSNRTVIDGNNQGTTVVASSVNSSTRLDGFSVQNGSNNGILCLNGSALTIANCIFTANQSYYGGAINCTGCSPTITANQIVSNSADGQGGGIYCENASPTIAGNRIAFNSASGDGGGIYCYGNSAPIISLNTILNNRAGSGGGIYIYSGSPLIRSNTIKGNRANANGGGIYCDNSGASIRSNFIDWNNAVEGGGLYLYSSTVYINNNTIVGNSAAFQSGGGAVTLYTPTYNSSTNPVLGNNIIAYNSSGILRVDNGKTFPAFSHNCFAGNTTFHLSGVSGGNTDIYADPGFLNATVGDYHLVAGTACVNAGDDTLVVAGSTDVDEEMRLVGSHVDIGADEYSTPRTLVPSRAFLYVTTTGNNALAGTSWSQAKHSVASALAAANSGDSIWVAAGAYPTSINLAAGVSIYGGFNGTETSVTQRNAAVNVTTLDGSGQYTVVRASSVGTTTILSDVTVRNGRNGIDCEDASPTITNDIISGNSAYQGGGLYCSNASPILSSDYIQNNAASYGGGIYITNSPTLTLQLCVIKNNTADSQGGGIYCNGNAVITGNVLLGNSSDTGGGLYFMDSNAMLTSNMIVQNRAGHGAGLFLTGSSLLIANNTIASNVAVQAGDAGGISMQSDYYNASSPTIACNVIAFNTGYGIWRQDTSCNPQPASNCFWGNTGANYTGMAGSLSDNFVDPHFVSLAGGDYHLAFNSPCINAGDNRFVSAGEIDVDNQTRIAGARVDIGADEYVLKRGPAQFFWQHAASGDVVYWQMNGASIAASSYINTISDPNWKIVATADLFHSGNTDLIWQNRSSGDIVYWETNGAAIVGSGYIRTLADKNWKIVGAADLFHNGHTDLIWQNNASGDVVYWELNGVTLIGSGYIKTLTDLNWKIVATADLFHDGNTSLVWQNRASGDIVYWELDGAAIVSSGYVSTLSDKNWTIVGATDLSRDGNIDLIWQNGASGDVVYWQMNGALIVGSGYIKTIPDLNWKITGVR
jgi:predicted outer membrane repeat protein